MTARRAGDRLRLPSRSELPAWAIVQEVPALGTTWYERGLRYWTRRAGLTLFLAALTPFMAFLTWVVVRSAGPPGSTPFLVVGGVVAAYTVVTFALTLVMLPRRAGRAAGPTGDTARHGRTGARLGMAAQAGNALAGVLVGVGAVVTLGFWAGGLVLSLLPTLPAERVARQRLAELLRAARNGPA